MVLDSLLELVETLQARIGEHGASLRQNEMRTRYALIDPLLQQLGWDTTDPSEVMIEDGSGDGRADYLLLDNSQPVMIIEAKRLGLGVSDGRQQAVNYAMDPGRKARYFAVTDGNQWEIYDTHQPAINMLVISFALKEDVPAEVCLKAMALWRPAVEHGSVMAAETPIVGLDAVKRAAPDSGDLPIYEPEPTQHEQPATRQEPATVTQSGETGQEWVALSALSPQGGDAPPIEIQFPDNSKVTLGRWNTVLVESVRWLYKNNYLNASNWRIQRGSRYIVSDTSIHPSGKEFTRLVSVGSLYVEINYSALYHVQNAQTIIEHTGRDPAQFKVRF